MTKYIIIGAIILALILGVSFSKKKGDEKGGNGGCPDSFSVDPAGAVPGIAGIVTTTYIHSDGKYYRQYSGGYGGAAAQFPPMLISKEVFMKACERYKAANPK